MNKHNFKLHLSEKSNWINEAKKRKHMKIYLIEHENYDYESYMAHVIVANNENEVITLAKKICKDEGADVWSKAKITKEGNYSGSKKEPFILLSDFRAG